MTHCTQLINRILTALKLPYTRCHYKVSGIVSQVHFQGVRYEIEVKVIGSERTPSPELIEPGEPCRAFDMSYYEV